MRRHQKAFTLVEMALVIGIIAILVGVGAPKYAQSVAHYRVETAASRLAADLAATQSQARASSKPQTLTFTTATTYTVPVKDLTTAAATMTVNLATGQTLARATSISFNGTSSVTFDIYGKPDNGGSVVLQVGTWTKTVVLNPDSGKATVQ